MTSADPAARQHAAVPGEVQRATEAALLGQTYARLPVNVGMTVAASLAFFGLLLPFFPLLPMLSSLAVLLVVSAARYALSVAWARAQPAAPSIGRWRVALTISAWLSGGSWAFGAVTLMPAAGRPETMLLVLCLMTVSAVAVATLATQRAATMGFLLSALGPSALMMFVVGGDVERVAALAMLAALACLLVVGRASNANAEAQARAAIELADALAEARALAVERDALARVQANERERLASILECTDAGIGEWHVDTGAMVFNERWAASLGYTLEELQPLRVERWMELCHADDRPLVEDVVMRHFAGEASRCDVELRMRHREGHWVWIQIRGRLSRRGPEGEPLQMTGLHIDISERKLSEQRWQARAELSADGFWETDDQHRVRLWQAGVLNLLPVEAERLIGRRMDEVPGISAAPEVWPEFMHRLTTHQPFRGITFRVKAPDGALHWIETDGRPRFGADGVFAGYEGVARDVTDQQEAAIALQQAKAAAEAANRAKSSFLATMSHELRTPLNAVIGAAQLLRAQHIDAEQQAYLVDAIQRGGTNLLGLIENILDLSRIEAGQLSLDTADFDLLDCVEVALSTASIAAHAKGLRMACIVQPTLPAWRRGDGARLRQAVLNLLGNAVKFTDAGEVVVRVESASGPGHEAGMVRISVADTGVGIDEATLPHIFEPFRQAQDQANRRFGGSGLGLAIVRQLVAAMGGRVEVQSRVGEGSCFTLELPLPPAAEVPREALPLGRHVAFHEPHEPSAMALQAHLLRLGCEVQRCREPEDLRRWVQASPGKAPVWLLLAGDALDGQAFGEHAMDLVEPERLVVMADDTAHEAQLARDTLRQARQMIRPLTLAALQARLSQELGAGDALPGPASPESALGASTHVLVVEDDELNRSIVCGLLRHAGCHVTAAVDGHQALRTMAQRNDVDLVLMDWQMPDIDGLEVTRRLRAGEAGEAGRSVPIVALTANAFAEDRDACLAVGMNDFLTKPVLADRLLSTVGAWTRGRLPLAAPVPGPASGLPTEGVVVFDASVLATLPMVADGSQPQMVGTLLGLFEQSAARLLADVEQATRQGDRAALQRAMHTLKSSAAVVGAMEIATLADRQDTLLRSGAPPDAGLPVRLASAFERLRQAMPARTAGEISGR